MFFRIPGLTVVILRERMIRFWVDVAIRVSVIIAGMGASTALVPPAGGTIIELVVVTVIVVVFPHFSFCTISRSKLGSTCI
jgi:hypothetical protein